MGAPHISNFGKLIKSVPCGASSATAGGTGDASAVTGATIDRLGYGSAKFVIAYKTTLTDTKTLSYAAEYQESADGTNWDTATALQASTVAKTGDSTTNFVGQVEFNLDLSGKKKYIRFNFTPDLSASSTDTALSAAVAILGGAEVLPAA